MNPIEKARSLKKKHPNFTIYDWIDHFNILLVEEDFKDFIGAYRLIERTRVIWINRNLEDSVKKIVLYHELGHALLHKNIDCYFIRYNTRLKCSFYETEADLFSAEMSDLPDKIPEEYKYYTQEQLAGLYCVPVELVRLKYHV